MSEIDNYFKNFFKEKEGIQSWSYYGEDSKGDPWSFDYSKADILKIILSLSPSDKKSMRDKFVMIDFKNGDINHFLDYFLTGYAKHQMGKKL